MDIIKMADWIIDLGPEGGYKGSKIIAKGISEDVALIKDSFTGQYLKKILNVDAIFIDNNKNVMS